MSRSRNVVLTLGLYRGSGGPVRSVRAFQEALDASVISWECGRASPGQSSIWSDATFVRGSRVPLLRSLCSPVGPELTEAKAVAANAPLISVHTYWRSHLWWAHKMHKKFGVPYWFVPHGSLDPYVWHNKHRMAKAMFHSAIGRAFLRDAAAVVFATSTERDKAIKYIPHERTEVIAWPLGDADFIKRDEQRRRQVRASLRIPYSATVFLYLGRLNPMKRPLETISAFAQSGVVNAHLVIVGNDDGVSAEDCFSHALRLGVADRTHIVGALYGTRKSDMLVASDIYVSMSDRENFNFSAAEAIAAGLALILSTGNDLMHDLAEFPTVFAANEKNVDEFSRMMRAVALQFTELDTTNGMKVTEWAKRHFHVERFHRQVEQVWSKYSRLTAAGG